MHLNSVKTVPWEMQKRAMPAKRLLRLFFGIRLPSISTFGGKKHCLLVMEDSTNYACSYFLKDKCKSKNLIFGLIKNVKTKYGILVQYAHCNNARENVDFEWACEWEGMGIKLT